MKLSEAQFQQLKKYVDETMHEAGRGQRCPFCNSTNWDSSNEIFKLTAFQDGSGVPALPLCVVSCGNCGNTLFIDARVVPGLDLDG